MDKIYELTNTKDALKLLFILNEKGELFSKQIIDEGVNDRTLVKARKILSRFGLVELTKVEGSKRLYYKLTFKGKILTKKLMSINEDL